MSEENEGFLNRWSRRKQEAGKESSEEHAKIEDKAAPTEEAAANQETAEEEFDISTLPPIESITAGTDIRAFLSKGVPAALTQAALRQAWSADPAIRDYIGLSEYSWDFNAPGQYGFGALDPSVNIQDMVADVFGKVKEAASKAETLIENADASPPQAGLPHEAEELRSVELREHAKEESSADESSAHLEAHDRDKIAQAAVAPQHVESEGEPEVVPVRRHGGALPS